MITERYDYGSLKRKSVDGRRMYSTPDGLAVPSVTTILDKTKPEQAKKALREWKKRVGEAKAAEITKEAAGRGTRMHTWLEQYVKEDRIDDPGSNPYSQQSHKMANIIIEQGLSNATEFWGTEVPVYFPQVYAGTSDCIGVHNKSEAILDFKQTNKPKKREWIEDYFMQLCAYADAHNEVYGTNISKGVVLMCSKDYEYQEFVIEADEFAEYSRQWWSRVGEYYGA
jgi:genome maintenance exonuclease 1